ncbi:cobalt-precorrin 5A hydrolase [Geoalkalibacter halelectricus]|uniref:Cobalamin biosynthesis protein n=1 Tax=Geoalkalibacter halelectricus TaxID=2847045 RepID=A0ABY5ZPF1_9BACT|nr:cobalamin biosynthesis protein [Geoalkalibacter halelectricus]MDO3377532.1 cobalamin biosynthesis protein [Geoalkalibacter halelectricus]UWZ80709.1 cobalamin biosynthesis protein [Geoalkalibacter halelectricus]
MISIVAITPGGAELARRLHRELPHSAVFVPARLAQGGDQAFHQPLAQVLPELFAQARGLVCIMASGIVVRVLAPHLRGKGQDPAVVVMDEAGRFAISLLSGHLGGANDLARQAAAAVGAQAVITTATDVNGLMAWDDVARREQLAIEPLRNIRRLNSLLLERQNIALVDRRHRVNHYFLPQSNVSLVANFAEAMQSRFAGRVFVTHRLLGEMQEREDLLLLRPRDLVVGIGCNRGTSAEEIEEVMRTEFAAAFLAPSSIAVVASIEDKGDEEGLIRFAENLGVPLRLFSADELNRWDAPSGPSPHARDAVGAHGVCEPAALAAGNARTLLIKKKKRGNVTLAVAEVG